MHGVFFTTCQLQGRRKRPLLRVEGLEDLPLTREPSRGNLGEQDLSVDRDFESASAGLGFVANNGEIRTGGHDLVSNTSEIGPVTSGRAVFDVDLGHGFDDGGEESG